MGVVNSDYTVLVPVVVVQALPFSLPFVCSLKNLISGIICRHSIEFRSLSVPSWVGVSI